MRISELRDREDFDGIFRRTLERAMSEWTGHPVRVERPGRSGQIWREQELLSAYFVPTIEAPARRFLAESLRFTQDPLRLLPQAALATALSSPFGLRTFSRPAFALEPAIPDARFMVVVPGNRRIRLFDFASGRTRVVAKDGTDRSVLEREVAFRRAYADGPWIPVDGAADGHGWFDEAIVDAFPLTRLPPWLDYRRAELRSLEALERFAAPLRRPVALSIALSSITDGVVAACERLGIHGAPREAIVSRVRALDRGGQLLIGPSHGDCQPGNVLVDRTNGRVTWTDWEFHGDRSEHYDRLVFGLRFRFPSALADRVLTALAGRVDPALGLPTDVAARRQAIAVALSEDILLVLQARASTGLRGPPPSLAELLLALDFAGHR